MTAPLLVIGVGNPSRGDDALGPAFVERVEALLAAEIRAGVIEVLTDFQLQIEHALDLTGRARVVFVDASVRAQPPFELRRVTPSEALEPTTHSLSPAAVLATHARVVGAPPPAHVVAIRGERFELGEPLSAAATENLATALRELVPWLRAPETAP